MSHVRDTGPSEDTLTCHMHTTRGRERVNDVYTVQVSTFNSKSHYETKFVFRFLKIARRFFTVIYIFLSYKTRCTAF